jgi:hypothetical protein
MVIIPDTRTLLTCLALHQTSKLVLISYKVSVTGFIIDTVSSSQIAGKGLPVKQFEPDPH